MERAIALCGDREILEAADFAPAPRAPAAVAGADPIALPETGLDFERTVGHIERQILEEAMRKTGGNKSAAAEMLGLKRTTLAAKLRSLTASVS